MSKARGFIVKNKITNLYISRFYYTTVSWSKNPKRWTRRGDIISSIRTILKNNSSIQDEFLNWEIVELVEGSSSDILFYLNDIRK